MPLEIPSFSRLAVYLGVAGLAAGFGISFLVAPRYISTATLLYEDVGAAKDSGQSIFDRLRSAESRILSRYSLSELMQTHLNLYADARRKEPIEDVVETMRKNLQISAHASGPGSMEFQISFTYPDPVKAQGAVIMLTQRFFRAERARSEQEQEAPPPTTPREEKLLNYIARLQVRNSELEKLSGTAPAAVSTGDIAGRAMHLTVIDPASLPLHPIYPIAGCARWLVFLAEQRSRCWVRSFERERLWPRPSTHELADSFLSEEVAGAVWRGGRGAAGSRNWPSCWASQESLLATVFRFLSPPDSLRRLSFVLKPAILPCTTGSGIISWRCAMKFLPGYHSQI